MSKYTQGKCTLYVGHLLVKQFEWKVLEQCWSVFKSTRQSDRIDIAKLIPEVVCDKVDCAVLAVLLEAIHGGDLSKIDVDQLSNVQWNEFDQAAVIIEALNPLNKAWIVDSQVIEDLFCARMAFMLDGMIGVEKNIATTRSRVLQNLLAKIKVKFDKLSHDNSILFGNLFTSKNPTICPSDDDLFLMCQRILKLHGHDSTLKILNGWNCFNDISTMILKMKSCMGVGVMSHFGSHAAKTVQYIADEEKSIDLSWECVLRVLWFKFGDCIASGVTISVKTRLNWILILYYLIAVAPEESSDEEDAKYKCPMTTPDAISYFHQTLSSDSFTLEMKLTVGKHIFGTSLFTWTDTDLVHECVFNFAKMLCTDMDKMEKIEYHQWNWMRNMCSWLYDTKNGVSEGLTVRHIKDTSTELKMVSNRFNYLLQVQHFYVFEHNRGIPRPLVTLFDKIIGTIHNWNLYTVIDVELPWHEIRDNQLVQ